MTGDRHELKRAERELQNAGPAPIKTRAERRFAGEANALTSRDEFVDGLFAELMFFGFAAAKGIAYGERVSDIAIFGTTPAVAALSR